MSTLKLDAWPVEVSCVDRCLHANMPHRDAHARLRGKKSPAAVPLKPGRAPLRRASNKSKDRTQSARRHKSKVTDDSVYDNTYEHDTRPGTLTDSIADAIRIEFWALFDYVDNDDWRARHEPPRFSNTSQITTDALEDAMQMDCDDAMSSASDTDDDIDLDASSGEDKDGNGAKSGKGLQHDAAFDAEPRAHDDVDSDEATIMRELDKHYGIYDPARVGAPLDDVFASVMGENCDDPETELLRSPRSGHAPTAEWLDRARF